ncbi:MAG: DUF4012 domain-containing protein [Candidatus Moranbacteria bacterium]|nr:DUF4012 domain-containing protein [Candidatus Moranbacteria bacterium]
MDIVRKKRKIQKQVEKKIEEKIDYQAPVVRMGRSFYSEDLPYYIESDYRSSEESFLYENRQEEYIDEKYKKVEEFLSKKKSHVNNLKFSLKDLFLAHKFSVGFGFQRAFLGFAFLGISLSFIVFSTLFISKGLHLKEKVLGVSDDAYSSLDSAIENLKTQNFSNSINDFSEAHSIFSDISNDIDEVGNIATKISYYIPYASKLSSGKNLADAGKNLSLAGQSFSSIAKTLQEIKEEGGKAGYADTSILDILDSIDGDLQKAQESISDATSSLSKVKIDDIPKDKREDVLKVKNNIDDLNILLEEFSKNTNILVDLFGGNGPRKYLFLFQNNNEMRATGGFIGSYGLIDIYNGKIRKFFIDGIYNPDGQLIDKVVPPKPIQKISAAWSLHDSNWFSDFPTSARKAILFYEKTGGPTVDGVVTLTPVVMQKLLKITGPIHMEEYDTVIDSDNFVERIQFEVEVDYDLEENNPKKILADLAPLVLERLINSSDMSTIAKTLAVFDESLREKHILLYSSNNNLEEVISKMGWSGEVLNNSLDYLSVINTNINGYKTDGVIDESIQHKADILNNGDIIDTVTITRKHNGGNTDYEWWNKVNADYMRVYVPQGSQLLSVTGQTKELNESPLNYDALKFERDADVQREENAIKIDEKTTTRIYEDSGKTVFANWVYVSPKEEVVVEYKYLLPFSLEINSDKIADSYSLLAQKQSGSMGSRFVSEVEYPSSWGVEWKTDNDIEVGENAIIYKNNLVIDRFFGLVFRKK